MECMRKLKCKQLSNLVLDETNVKQLRMNVATTEKGDLDLVYVRENERYHWELGSKPFVSKKLSAKIPEFMSRYFNEYA